MKTIFYTILYLNLILLTSNVLARRARRTIVTNNNNIGGSSSFILNNNNGGLGSTSIVNNNNNNGDGINFISNGDDVISYAIVNGQLVDTHPTVETMFIPGLGLVKVVSTSLIPGGGNNDDSVILTNLNGVPLATLFNENGNTKIVTNNNNNNFGLPSSTFITNNNNNNNRFMGTQGSTIITNNNNAGGISSSSIVTNTNLIHKFLAKERRKSMGKDTIIINDNLAKQDKVLTNTNIVN